MRIRYGLYIKNLSNTKEKFMNLLETVEPIVAKMVYQKLESTITEKFSIRAKGIHGETCMGLFFETYFPNFSKNNLHPYVVRYYNGYQDTFNSIAIGKQYGIQIAKQTFMIVKKQSTYWMNNDLIMQKLQESGSACSNMFEPDSIFVIESESQYSRCDSIYEFTIFGKNRKAYRTKIIHAIQKVVNEKTRKDESNFIRCRFVSATTYIDANIYRRKVYRSDIIFPEMDELDKKIDYFVHNKDFYNQHNIPYRMSILLYGIPGTGKTSYFDYIATKYNCDIITIQVDGRDGKRTRRSISEILSEIKNTNEIQNEKTRNFGDSKSTISVVLLDELDLMLSDDMQLKDMLYLIDNIPENTIVGATTNHIDKLDPALIRSGRFDIRIELKDLNYDMAYQLCKNYEIQNIGSCIPVNLTDEEKEKFTINPAYLKTMIVYQLLKENGFDSEVKEILPED